MQEVRVPPQRRSLHTAAAAGGGGWAGAACQQLQQLSAVQQHCHLALQHCWLHIFRGAAPEERPRRRSTQQGWPLARQTQLWQTCRCYPVTSCPESPGLNCGNARAVCSAEPSRRSAEPNSIPKTTSLLLRINRIGGCHRSQSLGAYTPPLAACLAPAASVCRVRTRPRWLPSSLALQRHLAAEGAPGCAVRREVRHQQAGQRAAAAAAVAHARRQSQGLGQNQLLPEH